MQSPLANPGRAGWTKATSRTVMSVTGIEQVPLAAEQTPEPIAIPCVCSAVFVAAEVSIPSRSIVMSLAPGSSEITELSAPCWSPTSSITVPAPMPVRVRCALCEARAANRS
jgi:hypothetical protein